MSELKLCEFSLSTMGFDLEIKAQFFINPSGPKVHCYDMKAIDTQTGKEVTDRTTIGFLNSYLGPRMSGYINERYQG